MILFIGSPTRDSNNSKVLMVVYRNYLIKILNRPFLDILQIFVEHRNDMLIFYVAFPHLHLWMTWINACIINKITLFQGKIIFLTQPLVFYRLKMRKKKNKEIDCVLFLLAEKSSRNFPLARRKRNSNNGELDDKQHKAITI